MAEPRLKPARPKLPPHLDALLMAEVPRFSSDEFARRRKALGEAMQAAGASHLLLSGGERKGSATQWITGWPTSSGHFVVFTPGEQDVLSVKNPNNLPLAKILAPDTDCTWSAEGSEKIAIAELVRRGAKGKKVGIVGSYSHALHDRLTAADIEPVDVSRAYTRLRLVKSAEELDFLRVGCALTDLAVEALAREAAPGLTEHDLGDIIERAYVPWGGMTQIHYTSVTSMTAPDTCVPSQLPRMRKVSAGDVLVTEISVSFWAYPGQVQRTIAVGTEPTNLYTELHACAEATFNAIVKILKPGAHVEEVLQAARVIADRGFTICDDLVHGYVGGYLPPVLGTLERPSQSVPDFLFAENMTIVVQPSVVTKDGRAGVQTGELLHITPDGARRLHDVRWGFLRAG
jgi:Xaa-Pro aminopeptidase